MSELHETHALKIIRSPFKIDDPQYKFAMTSLYTRLRSRFGTDIKGRRRGCCLATAARSPWAPRKKLRNGLTPWCPRPRRRLVLAAGRRRGPAPQVAATAVPPGGPTLTILLVEDDPEVADMVAAMLFEVGHNVVRAGGTAAALDLLRGGQAADLMITDLVMPGPKSGVDLAHEAVALRPGLPVILSSGYTAEAMNSANGAPWPLLRKPYSADVLAEAIRQTMERASETIS